MTKEQCKKRMSELQEEAKQLTDQANRAAGTPEFLELIDQSILKLDAMRKLDSYYKKLLLKDLEHGSLTAIQACINYMFGIGG